MPFRCFFSMYISIKFINNKLRVIIIFFKLAVQRVGRDEGVFRHDGPAATQGHDSGRFLHAGHGFHSQNFETLSHSSGKRAA